MSIEDILGIGAAFTVVGGAIVGVVRWLDKGKIIQDIQQLKKDLDEAEQSIINLEREVKFNTVKDQELREKVIRIESSHDSLNTAMREMKDMLKEVLVKLEQRQDAINEIGNKVAILEEKVA